MESKIVDVTTYENRIIKWKDFGNHVGEYFELPRIRGR